MMEDDKATRKARVDAHKVFDQMWKKKLVPNRRSAYKWLRTALVLSSSQAHISKLSKDQCEKLVSCVYRDFPSLHTRYSRLLLDDWL